MRYGYTDERNALIVIRLLKEHNIKKVIVSPGATNINFVVSLQQDPWFEIYSAPDERSAGYMACGIAAEAGTPVVLSCTGATASRNYMPALTEAFYRKLPILVITSSRRSSRIGHNIDQVTDRTLLPRDVANISVQCPVFFDEEGEWACNIAANKAMLELRRRGGGPTHINLETNYSRNFSINELPETRVIKRYVQGMNYPLLEGDRIVIRVGAHREWDKTLTKLVEEFCEKYNAVVVGDHTSNYKGKYYIQGNLLIGQQDYTSILKNIDIMIHIGDIAAPLYNIKAKEVWRVNPDGEIRDTYRKLKNVFEMEEGTFFEAYNILSNECNNAFYNSCCQEMEKLQHTVKSLIDDLPFSNAWIASQTAHKIPNNSVLHLGIQNSLRFWNMFGIDKSVLGFCNTGGYGIDGSLSTVLGASLVNSEKIYFCVLGDLAFFYDMNVLGNHHLKKNIRILLVNNGIGAEFKLSGNAGYLFGEDTDKYIAAAGHYGNKSTKLVQHYAEDLGFEYLSATTKEEYLSVLDRFVQPDLTNKPIILEVFTNSCNEDNAHQMLVHAMSNNKNVAKNMVKNLIGNNGVEKVRKILKK